MAFLIVTFTRAGSDLPVMSGRIARTEKLLITSGQTDPVVGNLVCDPGDNNQENVVDLLAEAACWVEIGENPAADDPSGGMGASFKLKEGERMQRFVVKGDRVSVVTA